MGKDVDGSPVTYIVTLVIGLYPASRRYHRVKVVLVLALARHRFARLVQDVLRKIFERFVNLQMIHAESTSVQVGVSVST